MLLGTHVVLFSRDAAADRAFFREVLGLGSIDAGGDWLIFELPPAEVGVHPAEENRHELYLMCDDIQAMVSELGAKRVKCSAIERLPWGLLIRVTLPGGGKLGIYQPEHPSPPRRFRPAD